MTGARVYISVMEKMAGRDGAKVSDEGNPPRRLSCDPVVLVVLGMSGVSGGPGKVREEANGRQE